MAAAHDESDDSGGWSDEPREDAQEASGGGTGSALGALAHPLEFLLKK